MNLTGKSCRTVREQALQIKNSSARFPRMILGFPSGDTGFPAYQQCWREKVPQDAEEEREKVN